MQTTVLTLAQINCSTHFMGFKIAVFMSFWFFSIYFIGNKGIEYWYGGNKRLGFILFMITFTIQSLNFYFMAVGFDAVFCK